MLLAALTEKEDLIVRMFRLPQPTTESVYLFVGVVGSFLLALVLVWVAGHRREMRRRFAAEEKRLLSLLSAARLRSAELQAFDRLVRESGLPALRCATVVEAFDRGVERLLALPLGGAARRELLHSLRRLRLKLGFHRPRRGVPLRSTRAIPRGQPLLLAPRGSTGCEGPVRGTLLSTNEDTLTVLVEGGEEAARLLRGRPEMEVIFFREGDASYAFDARVVGLHELDAFFVVLAHPQQLQRIQKRRFARVDLEEEVRFRWIPESQLRGGEDLAGSREALLGGYEGVLINLSASGLRLRTRHRLSRGDFIVLALPFLPPPLNTELCSAVVVQAGKDGVYGLSFEGMPPRLQAAVMQHVRRHEVQAARQVALERGPAA